MKVLITYLPLLYFVSLNLQAQDISQEHIQEDFDFLNNALAEGHPGLYWFNSEQEFNESTKKVETVLGEVNNVAELQSLFVDVINSISCGHTVVMLPEIHYQKIDSINLFLPFNIALVEGKVIIAESFTDDLSRGYQLLSINGESINDVIQQLQRFIPIDKGITMKRSRDIEIVFPYFYAVYKGSPQKFAIEYKVDTKGEQFNKEIEAVANNEKMHKSAREFASMHVPIELSVNDADKTVILKLATFSGQSFKKNEINFRDTIKHIFEYLEKNNVNNLVIDLRWNNGGTMPLAEYLFSFFIDSTYQYYDDAEIRQSVMEGISKYGRSRNMKPMLEKQFGILEPENSIYYLPGEKVMINPTKPLYNGELYLLTNGLSFSATAGFISHVQQNNLGLVIGETPGGAFAGVNAGPQMIVELPNSKIRLYYRIIGTRYNVDASKVRVKVDIKIDNTLDGFTEGNDVQLEYVLKLIKE